MNYRILTPALIELREAAEYYETQVAGLGADFISETEFAIDRILQFPNAWGRISGGHRHCNLRRFPSP
jgi:toxin ParE1/3/4